jgi:predicted acetyltransferase
VPELIMPDVRVHESFLEAMAEFRAEGRGDPVDDTMIGAEMREFSSSWSTPEGFAAFVAALRAQAAGEHLPAGFVPCTTLWWAEDYEYLGRIAIRHGLTPRLLEAGGHVGYDVRPTARRRGHATAMLRAALPAMRNLGIRTALVTCDVTNTASRKVIECCGGDLEDQRGEKLRFWLTTHDVATTQDPICRAPPGDWVAGPL